MCLTHNHQYYVCYALELVVIYNYNHQPDQNYVFNTR